MRASFLSPLNNIYACLGPAPLVSLFSQTWSALCVSDDSTAPVTLQGTYNSPNPCMAYRLRKVKLTHLPATFTPTSMPLMTGFAVRVADQNDDLKAIAKLLRDYRVEINPSNREHVSYDAMLRDVDAAVKAGHVWVYEVSSRTMAGLRFYPGFLKVGAETETSIALVEIYTGAAWRKRGVAESLIRETVIHYLTEAKKKQVVCLLPDVAESAARVCARVGFRVLERSKWFALSKLLLMVANIFSFREQGGNRLWRR
jgi:predicted GNAT family N-acyltransferase